MMEMINHFIDMVLKIPAVMSQMEIIPGVSILAVIVAVFIIGLLVNQLVKRAGA